MHMYPSTKYPHTGVKQTIHPFHFSTAPEVVIVTVKEHDKLYKHKKTSHLVLLVSSTKYMYYILPSKFLLCMQSHSQIQFCLLNFMTNIINILQSEVLVKQKTCRKIAFKRKTTKTHPTEVGKLQPMLLYGKTNMSPFMEGDNFISDSPYDSLTFLP